VPSYFFGGESVGTFCYSGRFSLHQRAPRRPLSPLQGACILLLAHFGRKKSLEKSDSKHLVVLAQKRSDLMV